MKEKKYLNNQNFKSAPLVNYDKLYKYTDEVFEKMKDSPIYKKWSPFEFDMFYDFARQFSIDKDNIMCASTKSFFVKTNMIKDNFETIGSPNLENNYVKSFIRILMQEKNLLETVFPKFYSSISREIGIIRQFGKEFFDKTPEKRDLILLKVEDAFALLFKSMQKNVSILRADAREYFRNTNKYLELGEKEKEYFWDELVHSYLICEGMGLYEIRFAVIKNLRARANAFNGKTLLEIFNFEKFISQYKPFFYIPVSEIKYEMMNREFPFIGEIINLSQENEICTKHKIQPGLYFVVNEQETKATTIIENIRRMENIDQDFYKYKYDSKREIYFSLPNESSESEANESNESKKIGTSLEKHFDNYFIKPFKNDDDFNDYIPSIVKELRNRAEALNSYFAKANPNQKESRFYEFVNRCIDSIYHFKNDKNSKIETFLNFWFVIESIRSTFSNRKFNEAMVSTMTAISKYKWKGVEKFDIREVQEFFEEMIMFRNSLIHGSTPNQKRVGVYNFALSLLVTSILDYSIENKNHMEEISFPDFLSVIKFDV